MDNFQLKAIDIKNWSCINLIVPDSPQTGERGINMECVVVRYVRFLNVGNAVELRKKA